MLYKFIKRNIYLLLLLFPLCVLAGCTDNRTNVTIDYMESVDEDNSLDKYFYTERGVIKPPKADDAIEGGASSVVLARSGGYYYKKVVHEDYSKDYDTLSFSDNVSKEMLKWNDVNEEKSKWAAGSVVDSDDFLIFCMSEYDPITYEISRYNKSGELIESVATDLGNLNEIVIPDGLMMDRDKMIHLAYRNFAADPVSYYVISPEGKLIHKEEYVSYSFNELVELPNGEVAIEICPLEDNYIYEYQIDIYDSLSDEMQKLMTWDYVKYSKSIREKNPNADKVTAINAYNMFDENRLIVATPDGVYIVDKDKMENTLLYEWANHGISPSQVYCIRADEDKNIYLMYGDEEGINYLELSPTTEERPIKKILFAVSEVNKDKYMSAVAKFNKKHPTCVISLQECQYSDQQKLITKMSAGEGAVIFDTSLVGFLQLDKMWEPLDDCFEKEAMTAFNEEVINLGKIDGRLYGAITDFYIETAFTNEKMPNMDYDSFIEAIGNYSGKKELFNFGGDEGVEEFVLGIMCHNQSDCYFINNGKFDEAKFKEAVELAEKYTPIEDTNGYYSSDFEEAYLNMIFVDNPAQIEIYRMRYGENIDFIGLPGEAGSVSYLHGAMPVCIRSNADKEEKELAKAFIKELLSYEANKSMSLKYDYGLSVRKDVLDEQIEDIPYAVMDMMYMHNIFIDESLVDIEKAGEVLKNIITTARSFQEKDFGYRQIISEELDLYLSDAQTFETMLDHVKSRVNIYLEEKK